MRNEEPIVAVGDRQIENLCAGRARPRQELRIISHERDRIVGNVVGQTPIDLQLMTNKEITLKTSFRYRNIYPTAIDAVSSGRINVKSIVSRYYALQDAPQAFEDCINEKASMVKAVIEFESA